MESGDSVAMMKARYYLESENLNETILLPMLAINGNMMRNRLSGFGGSMLFTNIEDMKPEDLIDFYRKRNRVEHCFRTISMRDFASPVYHWTPQKIRVHMLFPPGIPVPYSDTQHGQEGGRQGIPVIST